MVHVAYPKYFGQMLVVVIEIETIFSICVHPCRRVQMNVDLFVMLGGDMPFEMGVNANNDICK